MLLRNIALVLTVDERTAVRNRAAHGPAREVLRATADGADPSDGGADLLEDPSARRQHPLEHAEACEGAGHQSRAGRPGLAARWPATASRRPLLLSDDPAFEQKAADVIGLCLNAPQHAAMFAADETSAIRRIAYYSFS